MLNSNNLKIIAIFCMIIDHIGYYFSNFLDYEVYFTFRCIGRIAMPLFLFLLVQGFFKTSNLKKYILRIGIIAIITEIIIKVQNYINVNNNIVLNVKPILPLNVLFSFILILITLRLIDRKIFKDDILDIFSRVMIITLIVLIYLYINIDYRIYGLIIGIIMYFLEKLKQTYNNDITKTKISVFSVIVQFFLIVPIYIMSTKSIISIFSAVAFLIILLYNGQKGIKNKFISITFYLIFPLQYLSLYTLALIIQ